MPDLIDDPARVRAAIEHLRHARDLLRAAECPRTLARVQLALSSAKGAARAVGYRKYREPDGAVDN